MAKFVYRMQSLLNIQYQLESQAKMELGRAQRRLNEEEEKLQILIGRKAAYLEEGRRIRSDKLHIMDLKDKSHVGASIILEELLSSSILTYIYFYNLDKDYPDVMSEYAGKDIYAKLEVILNELKKPDFNYEDNLNHKLLMLSSSIYTDLEMDPAYTIELKLFNISVDLQHRISNNLTRMEEQMRKNREAEKEQK